MDLKHLSVEMASLVNEHAAAFRAMPAEAWTAPRGDGKWTRLQELGHLIDSATHNHQRFTRALIFDSYAGPAYPQEAMVSVQQYGEAPPAMILNLWESYNLFLARLIGLIPPEKLGTLCKVGDYEPVTLEFLATDYLNHTLGHLSSIRLGL